MSEQLQLKSAITDKELHEVLNKQNSVLSIAFSPAPNIAHTILFIGKKYHDLWIIDFDFVFHKNCDLNLQIKAILNFAKQHKIKNINSDWGTSYTNFYILKNEISREINKYWDHNQFHNELKCSQIMYLAGNKKIDIDKHNSGYYMVNRNNYVKKLINKIKDKQIILPSSPLVYQAINDLSITEDIGIDKLPYNFNWDYKNTKTLTCSVIIGLINILIQDDIDKYEEYKKAEKELKYYEV